MDDIRLVTTVVDDRAAAEALADGVVAARLAACVQVGGPVHSTYRWQGRIETAEEWTVAAKTTAGRVGALVEHVRAAHPYDVPEILVTPVVGGSADYLAWVRDEVAERP